MDTPDSLHERWADHLHVLAEQAASRGRAWLEEQAPQLRRMRQIRLEMIEELPPAERDAMRLFSARYGGERPLPISELEARTGKSMGELKRLWMRLYRESHARITADEEYQALHREHRRRVLGE